MSTNKLNISKTRTQSNRLTNRKCWISHIFLAFLLVSSKNLFLAHRHSIANRISMIKSKPSDCLTTKRVWLDRIIKILWSTYLWNKICMGIQFWTKHNLYCNNTNRSKVFRCLFRWMWQHKFHLMGMETLAKTWFIKMLLFRTWLYPQIASSQTIKHQNNLNKTIVKMITKWLILVKKIEKEGLLKFFATIASLGAQIKFSYVLFVAVNFSKFAMFLTISVFIVDLSPFHAIIVARHLLNKVIVTLIWRQVRANVVLLGTNRSKKLAWNKYSRHAEMGQLTKIKFKKWWKTLKTFS